jgi:tetratricopeptide (TPR) repeat protein
VIKKLFFLILFLLLTGTIAYFAVPNLSQRINRKVLTAISEIKPHDQYLPTPAIKSPIDFHPNNATPSPTIKLSVTPTLTPTLAPPPTAFSLTGLKHEYQTWNNCAPASTAMLLSFYGKTETQKDIAPFLKPNWDDKNVSPSEVLLYLQTHTEFGATYRINGDLTLLKRLVSNNIPLMVETWFEYKPNDGMGHFRIVKGYSDEKKEFYVFDSYKGPNIVLNYSAFDEDWKVFNRTYIIAYKKSDEKIITSLLGESIDDKAMNVLAQKKAEQEITTNDKDAYAWFDLGDALSRQGKHTEAAQAFDKARQIGLPWRMLWYQFTIFDSYLATDRYQDVITLTTANLKQTDTLEESFYYRGKAYQAQGKTALAKSDFEKVVKLNPLFERGKKELEK